MAYNMTELTSGTNIVDWVLIVNSWGDGLIFGAFILMALVIMFAVSQRSQNDISNTFIFIGILGVFISGAAWLLRYNSEPLVPTVIPVICGIVAGLGILFKILNNIFE